MKSVIFVFIFYMLCHGVVLSQDIETILEGIKANESSIRSGSGNYTYQYSLNDTTNMKYFSKNKKSTKLELSMVSANRIDDKSYIGFQGKKQYYEVESLSIIGGYEKHFEKVHMYYDGKDSYVQIFSSASTNGLMAPKAYIKNGKELGSKKSVLDYLYDGRRYENPVMYNIVKNQYKELKYINARNFKNMVCIVFSGSIIGGGDITIWFSEKHNFMPLHVEEDYMQKYGTKIIRDIEYKESDGVYFPNKIIKMHYIKGKNGMINNYTEAIYVNNIEINIPVNDNLFKSPFEKGIKYYDYRSKMTKRQR